MVWPLITAALLVTLLGWAAYSRSQRRADAAAADRRLAELAASHQAAVAALRSQQETVLNSMVEGLLLRDRAGHVEFANTAFLRLFETTGEVRGKSIIEIARLHELADIAALLDREGLLLGRELRLTRPHPRVLEVNGAPILEGGQVRGSVLVFHDITRIKELEQRREEFVANVSHELRTPLSLIKGYAETLLDGARDNPEVAPRFLQSIDRNAERLRLIIEDLLTISELESGRIRLDLATVPLAPLVEKVLADLTGRAAAKDTQLVNRTPALSVSADPGRLSQVLCNLVDNAIKYGKAGGRVEVTARSGEGSQVELCVTDDGPGIPAEAHERVFERFYRLDKARSREQGGTGLGLAIVKHIVQSHGGKAWVTSSPGQGAQFHFTLPAAPAAGESAGV